MWVETYIHGVLKLKRIPDIDVLHQIMSALTDNSMTKIAVSGDFFPIFRSEKIILVASETSLCFKMSDMIRIGVIGYLHPGKSILAVSLLQRRH